jgi:outer membrane protein assembly factor BamB
MPRRIVPALLGALAVFAAGADWPQFRGPAGTAVADGPAPPAEVGPDRNLAWKAPLPGRGASGPLVIGDRVFVTASGGPRQDRLSVLAFAAADGKELWRRTLFATGPTASHPKTCMAAPTPASDGKRLVALFATNDLACLDLDGNLLWARCLYEEVPGATDGRGLASSPVIVGDTAVIHVETQNASFAAGIDLATGADRWRTDRPRDFCWNTPTVLPKWGADGTDLVLLQGHSRLSACDPRTGKEAWHLERKSDAIASSVLHGDVLYVPGEGGLAALQRQPNGAPPKQLWEQQRLNPTTASPVVVGDRVYSLRGSVLAVGDVKTGAVTGQLRLRGSFAASPVAAGGLIYCVSEDGLVQVVKPGEKEPTVAASGGLGETILATPAVASGALYLRSDPHLWKFATN